MMPQHAEYLELKKQPQNQDLFDLLLFPCLEEPSLKFPCMTKISSFRRNVIDPLPIISLNRED
jgi:hypothetical protein